MEDGGNLDPAPPAQRAAAPAAAAAEVALGGPCPARYPARRHTERAALGTAAADYLDTIVRWHRDIVRRRWAARSNRGRTGRPPTRRTIRALARLLARGTRGEGYGG